MSKGTQQKTQGFPAAGCGKCGQVIERKEHAVILKIHRHSQKKDSENDGRNHQEFCAGIIGFEKQNRKRENKQQKTEIPEKTVHEHEKISRERA